jgi:hypothetical protein
MNEAPAPKDVTNVAIDDLRDPVRNVVTIDILAIIIDINTDVAHPIGRRSRMPTIM